MIMLVSSPSIITPAFPELIEDWAALRTSARWEKKIADGVARADCATFLPTFHRISSYRGKRRSSEVPLFSGYVFVSASGFIGNSAIPRELRSKIAQILKPTDPEQLRNELLKLAGLITDRKLVQERVVGQIGDPIRIVGGPLVGTEGKIVRLKPNRYAVIVEISMIGAKREVELSEGMITRDI